MKMPLATLLANSPFAPYIAENRLIPAREAHFVPFPTGLDEGLARALRARGINEIYSHQAECFNASNAGKNVVVVTPTASGKTLCYNLPVLQTLLRDQSSRALYLFPTKALSQDQQAELNEIVKTMPVKVATYDGDTPDSLRSAARDTGRIIISNPDMLHQGIMPNHPKWIKFFSNLKYIVIDEAHAYRGVFGSHVANVIRRLKRIAAFYHASPQFILCSATIANPKELAEALCGEDVVLVDKNGAPSGEKRIILYNPPLIDPVQGIRRSSLNEARRWMLFFLRSGIKTILFAHSRIKTEVAASYVRDDLKNINNNNENIKVETYRGGLLPNERHEIERGLRDGTIQGVVSTNALELGIDIGGLDASIVCGFPGSFNSFWQQSGRAGRRSGASIAVFVASASPLDQFIMRNPDWFFRKSAEEGRLNADNPYIYTDHIKCACFELPFKDASPSSAANGETGSLGVGDTHVDGESFGPEAADALSFLEEQGVLRHTAGRWHWADRSFPAEGVNLRSAVAENIIIVDITHGKHIVIGEMDRPSAKEMLFKGAVYLHRGDQYIVTNLDIQNKKAFVEKAQVNFFTDGLVKTDIHILSHDEDFIYKSDDDANTGLRALLGDVLVRTQVSRFKKLKFKTHENIGYGEIALPEEETQTRALILQFDEDTAGGAALADMDDDTAASALHAAGTLIKHIAPVYLLCDPKDLGIAERIRDPHSGAPSIYIYDKYPGGTGLAEALADKVPLLLRAIYSGAAACPCKNGCPSCTGPGEDKEAALRFLAAIQSAPRCG